MSDDTFHSMMLLRSVRGSLGGKPVERLALSAKFSDRAGSYWVTVPEASLAIGAGDWIEMDLSLMPHGDATQPWFKPERERVMFGTGKHVPSVPEVKIGTLISEFPAVVRAENNAVRLTRSGGNGPMPLVVEDWDAECKPLVWINGVLYDSQLHGGDYYQLEPASNGNSRLIVSPVIRWGQRQDLLVTSAKSSTGILRVQDDNGRLVIHDPPGSTITAHVPRPLFPGRNVYDPKRRLFAFTGSGEITRELPLRFTGADAYEVQAPAAPDESAPLEFTVVGAAQLDLDPAHVEAGWQLRATNDLSGQVGQAAPTVTCTDRTRVRLSRQDR